MIIKEFDVITSEDNDAHIVTNGNYSVKVIGKAQAYMVCNMVNCLVWRVNFKNEGLIKSIDNICREINDKPTMTTTEVMVKLQELIF